MTTTFEVTGAYTLSGAQADSGDGALGDYTIDASSTFTLSGSLSVTDSTPNVYLAGVTASGAGAQFTVGAGGVMHTSTMGAAETTFGFFTADQAGFENDGTFTVSSAGYASGVAAQAAATFVNTGSFTVTAGNDMGQGFGAGGVATVTNTGTITVSGQVRVDAFDLTGGGTLTNGVGGVITATSSGSVAYGVVAGGVSTINNSGTITGGTAAINAISGSGAMTLVNSGTLNGAVILDAAPGNSVTNTGAIHGEVSFGGTSGQQTYNGVGGTLVGAIVFGSGATGLDTAHLGADGETVQGGSANLIVYGGAGNDSITGGTGVNWIDGGAGTDTLTGGGAHDTFVMDGNVGNDNITNFNVASDVIDISAFSSLSNLAQVLAASSQTTTGGITTTTIHLGSGSVALHGVAQSALTAADFAFTSHPPAMVTGSSANNFSATFQGTSHQYTIGAAGSVVVGGPDSANDYFTGMQHLQFADGYETYSTTDPAAEVYRLYEATLNRGPDPEGLASWVSALNSGTSLQTVANGFVSSTEFQQDYGNLNNSAFINLLYENVLHRAPDPTGDTFWLGQMSSGQTQAQVVLGFSESTENINDSGSALSQGLWVGNTNAAEVARLYDTTLGRLPDLTGLTSWTNALNTGTSLQSVVNGFVGSTEFQNTYGSLNNNDFVTLLYENTLHRAPDPTGMAFWVGQLTSNTQTRAQVVLGFSDSTEHIADTAPHIDHGIWVI
jgi:hypothetical protein